MKLKKILTLAAVLAACSGAQAAIITSSYGLPVVTTNSSVSGLGGQEGNLALFDSNLGTLTFAKLDLFGSSVLGFTGVNPSQGSARVTLTSNMALVWDSSINAIDPFISEDMFFSYTSGSQLYSAGQTINFPQLSQEIGQRDHLETILASLQAPGGGMFRMSCTSASDLSVAIQTGGTNFNATQDVSQFGCGARIEYEYTEKPTTQVPEPASLALVALALAGAGFVTRRRKAGQS